jgi:hypothetical protein
MVGKLTRDDQASASVLPAIMGLNKYKTANDVLGDAIRSILGQEREDFKNEAMGWGNTFEHTILKEAAMRLGLDNLDISHDHPFTHRDLPLSCSLDGTAYGRGLRITTDQERGIFVMGQDEIILDGMGVMEAKLTAADVEDSPPLWRGPVQLQAQMDIMEAKWGAVCTLYRGVALRIYLFAPHDGTLAAIRAAVLDFDRRLHAYRQDGVIEYYPPADSADANRAWPAANDEKEPLVFYVDEENMIAELILEKDKIKAAEKKIDEIEKSIKEKMKDHPSAIAGKYEVRWPMRYYKAQPSKIVPATEARAVRQSTLTIKERKV